MNPNKIVFQSKGIARLFKRLLGVVATPHDISIEITDRTDIESFISNPNNTFLVSFPRTGSHWLRMLMELYFVRPSLVRVFYYPERKNYLTLHTHDLEMNVERSNVIYLYRNPVDTIYSQLRYHKEDIEDHERITFWADLYGRHLDKWLHKERFTDQKTVVRYEDLKTSPHIEFRKICDHFGKSLNTEQFDLVSNKVSKERVKKKTFHDRRVINLTDTYARKREYFVAKRSYLVWQVLLNGRDQLQQYF